MARLRRFAALVRVMLVAIGLCLAGVGHPPAAAADPGIDAHPNHCASVDLPEPGPVLTEERAADERVPLEDAAAAAPSRHLDFVPSPPRRPAMARGPPSDPPSAAGRPRSSRGPPGPV